MKKVFRTHIVLVTEGRFFMLFCLLFLVWRIYVSIYSIIRDPSTLNIFCLIFDSFLLSLFYFGMCPFFWPRCFGKLIVTDEKITWKCLGMLTRSIAVEDINYAVFRVYNEDNVVRTEVYQDSFLYILLSKEPIPEKTVNKYKCGKSFIIFSSSPKLCKALGEVLPYPQNKKFIARGEEYDRIIRKRKRKKEEKREKRRLEKIEKRNKNI